MYKYKILSFRLINGLATYQQYINNILFNYFDNFYIVYLNNIMRSEERRVGKECQ